MFVLSLASSFSTRLFCGVLGFVVGFLGWFGVFFPTYLAKVSEHGWKSQSHLALAKPSEFGFPDHFCCDMKAASRRTGLLCGDTKRWWKSQPGTRGDARSPGTGAECPSTLHTLPLAVSLYRAVIQI